MGDSALAQAETLIQRGAITQAFEILKPIVQEGSNSEPAAYLLGICYFRLQKFNDAEALFRRSISNDTHNHLAYYYLGLALERQDRRPEAEVEYRIALAINPEFKEAQQKLGMPEQVQPPNMPSVISMPEQVQPPKTPAVMGGSTRGSAVVDTLARRIELGREDELRGPDRRIAGDLLYEGHRRMRSFSASFVLMVLLILLGVAAIAVGVSEGLGVVVLVPFALAAFLFLRLMISSIVTKFWFYEGRIDLHSGILFKKKTTLWLYQVDDTWLSRSPLNLLTNDATISIRAGHLETPRNIGVFKISGVGNARSMEWLWQELRDSAITERRAMKSIWT